MGKNLKNKLTQEELKKYLHYDPETGLFTWKVKKARNTIVGSVAGTPDKDGYILIGINKVMVKAHRLAFLYMEGYFPENDVDHINRIKDDNRWCNLREVSKSCNQRNCGVYEKNKIGITGVYWHERDKLWMSYIGVYKKTINLGCHKNKLDAAKARWEAEKKYGWPNCCTTSSAYQYIQKHENEARNRKVK